MKECEEEVLTPLVKMLKYQEYCKLILKKDVRDSHLLLYKNGLCWCHEGLVEKFPSIVVELCFNAVIDGMVIFFKTSLLVGVCCTTVRTEGRMRDSELKI